MTREQAFSKVQLACVEGEAHGLIRTLENLGLLKLDEPKSAWAKFAEVMVNDFGYSKAEHCQSAALHSIKESLNRAGLKIVEA